METGKTSKYLKYAIGEIVLVMIGILLALQVNTWNTNRELKKEELQIMKSLHQEFNENLVRFNQTYSVHLNRRKAIETAIVTNYKKISLDNMITLFDNINNNQTYDPLQGIYNSIINSGKIELISNDSLKLKISRFQDLFSDYREEEQNTMRYAEQNIYPFLIDKLKMDFNILLKKKEVSERAKETFKQDLIELMTSDKYENVLTFLDAYMVHIFIEGPILREEMVSIINVLESEIETHN